MIKFSWSKNYLWPLVGLFLISILLESVSLIRIVVASLESDHEINLTRGSFHKKSLSKYRGWEMLIINDSEQISFSCELPGVREFSSCFRDEPYMNEAQVKVIWFNSPSNVFYGHVRHPILIEFVQSGTVINLGLNPREVLRNAAFNKLTNIFMLIAMYVAFYLLMRKLTAHRKGENNVSSI